MKQSQKLTTEAELQCHVTNRFFFLFSSLSSFPQLSLTFPPPKHPRLQVIPLSPANLAYQSWVFFCFCFNPFPKFSFSGEIFEENYILGTKRSLAEGPSDEAPLNSSYLVLAAKRTHRRDPLNDFKKYTGGWNISEPHYWTVSHSNLESLCLFVFLFFKL